MQHQVRLVTPAEAAEMLSKNTNNRRVRKGAIKRYAEEMRSGKWVMNGESIRWDKNGDLIDGQHRLMALASQENSIELSLMFELEPESKFTIDTGIVRTNADVLLMNGVSNSTRMGGVAKRVMAYNARPEAYDIFRKTGSSVHIENNAMVKFVQENHDYVDKLTDVAVGFAHQFRGLGMTQYAVFIHAYVEAGHDFDDMAQIFQRIVKGYEMSETDPLLHLRNKLQSWTMSHKIWTGDVYRNNVIKAINLHLEGKTTTALRLENNIGALMPLIKEVIKKK